MELKIIEFLQEYFFQGLIYIASYAGHLFVVLGVCVVLYIAVDKRLGGKALIFYFVSMFFNAYLKVWIGRGRPYTEGATQIFEKSTQPSMPSGHTQGLAAFLLPVSRAAKNRKRAYILSAVLLAFIAFSRVYLGQHYLSDVLVGAAIGLAVGVLVELLYVFTKDKANTWLLLLIPVAVTLMAVFSDNRDAFVSGGILVGSLTGIFLEQKYVRYEVRGSLLNRIVKVLFTLVVTTVCILVPVLLMDVIFENLAIGLIFFMMLFGVTYLSPLLLTKIKAFDHIFNNGKSADAVPAAALDPADQ